MTIEVPQTRRTEAGSITVGQLRAALAGVPDDVQIVMSKDGEGNGFSPLAEVEASLYDAESTWSGQTYVSHAVIDDPDSIYDEEDRAPDSAFEVVTLWPTN